MNISRNRLIKAERWAPQRENRFTLDEWIIESVDGREGRQLLECRNTSLPRRHLYSSVTIHFKVDLDKFESDPGFVIKRVWGQRKNSPPGICEVWPHGIPIESLPQFDIRAAVDWRIQYPSEWAPWGRESSERWIRVLTRLARGAPD